MGLGAKKTFAAEKETRWFSWLQFFGPKTLLLSWLPVIGDPLCAVAGWLKMPFWPCVAYMAIGKFLRYLILTELLMRVPDHFWQMF
jgi:membrane protein YqaA with SNARE-associated domain